MYKKAMLLLIVLFLTSSCKKSQVVQDNQETQKAQETKKATKDSQETTKDSQETTKATQVDNVEIFSKALTLEPLEGNNVKVSWDRISDFPSFKSYILSYYKESEFSSKKTVIIDSKDTLEATIALEKRGVNYIVELHAVNSAGGKTGSVTTNISLYPEVPSISGLRMSNTAVNNSKLLEWYFTPDATGFTRYYISYFNTTSSSNKIEINIDDINKKTLLLENLTSGEYMVKVFAVGNKETIAAKAKTIKFNL